MNEYIWESIKPTIEGICYKIQYCLEQLPDDFNDSNKYIIEEYAKLLHEMIKYVHS
ncbi:MAG: hypothetical protein ACFE8M_03955 [Candidatus Hermodarchaeota archaeon]